MLSLDATILSLEQNDIPSLDDLTSVLQRCRKKKNLAYARHVHAHICNKGLEMHKEIGNYIVPMFVECGSPASAEQMFHRLLHLNEFSWTSLMEGYIQSGNAQSALDLYENLHKTLLPTRYTFTVLLKACTKLKCLEKGRRMHIEIIKEEFESDQFIGSSLMGMYTKCGSLAEAQDVFEDLPVQDVVSWTNLLVGYVEHGFPAKALERLEKMQEAGIDPDRVTYIYGLKACSLLKCLNKGEKLHAEINQKGIKVDSLISAALLDMYVKCGKLFKAQEIFKKLPKQESTVWNILMSGYVEEQLYKEAINFYSRMMHDGVMPDLNTFVCILKACAKSKCIGTGREVHKEIDKMGLQCNPYVGASLVDMYAKCGCLREAQETFDQLPLKEVVSWTSLIAGYYENKLYEEALGCLTQMQQEGMAPDSITYIPCVKSCGTIGDMYKGFEIHESIVKDGYEAENRLSNALMDMYVRLRLLEEAQYVFDEIEEPDVVCWTALISAYSECGLGEAAANCFKRMQKSGVPPDDFTYACVLKIYSTTESITQGQDLYIQVVKNGFEQDPYIANCLMDLYVKCHLLLDARAIFDQLPFQDVVSWTALINGFVDEGFAEEALKCYEEMQEEGVRPNAVTYVCILRACVNLSNVRKLQQIHNDIIIEEFEETAYIGSSLISMYDKCGLILEAEGVFNDLKTRDLSSWNALILGYIDQGLGEEAFAYSKKMQEEVVSLDQMTYACSLKACGAVQAIDHGNFLHAQIIKKGYEQDFLVSNASIHMYVKCNLLSSAQSVFDRLSIRDAMTWNSLITGFADHDRSEEALKYLESMQEDGIEPNLTTYARILKLCGSTGDSQRGHELHSCIIKKGTGINQCIATGLVNMYANWGSLLEAQEIFEMVPEPDLTLWNMLIREYANYGLCQETLDLFQEMSVPPNAITYIFMLKAIKNMGDLTHGQTIHCHIVEEGYEQDTAVSSSLVDMYVGCGCITEAKEVFEELLYKDVIAWTAIIRGYSDLGFSNELLECYGQMRLAGILPDIVMMNCILQTIDHMEALERVRDIHVEIVKKGNEQDFSVGNHLVQLYAKCHSLSDAKAVFVRLSERDVISWTALMMGYADKGIGDEVLHFVECMQSEGLSLDVIAWLSCLRTISELKDVTKGHEIHDNIIKQGFDTEPSIGNTLVSMYTRCNVFIEAVDTFNRLQFQDVISWTALITGYGDQGLHEKAFDCFQQMQLEGLIPDVVTWNAVMAGYAEHGKTDEACILFRRMQDEGLLPSPDSYLTLMRGYSNSAALESLKKLHGQIHGAVSEANKLIPTVFLIEMYGKCGSMVEALGIFNTSSVQDSMMWNAMIAGFSRQGESEIAFCTLQRMMEEGVKPDDATFLSLLIACNHVGLLHMGQKCFECMSKRFQIMPTIRHYNCLIDLLGRAGLITEAMLTIDKMPFRADFVVWSTILGACHKWGEIELGKQAFQHAMRRLDGNHASLYVLMSNICADVDEEEEESFLIDYTWKHGAEE